METFKAIMLPLAVVLLGVAVVMPETRPPVRWALAGAAVVLAFIALFVALDATS